MNAQVQGEIMPGAITKPWLKSYPAGVPELINPNQFASVVDLIDDSCADFADKPAFTSMGRTITYADYEQLAQWPAALPVYELAGDTGFTLADVAAELAEQSGRPVKYSTPLSEVVALALKG